MARSYSYAWISDAALLALGDGVREWLASHFASDAQAKGGMYPVMESYRKATPEEIVVMGLTSYEGATCFRLDGQVEPGGR